jgi:putative SOS response-associated peptidase YedK
MCNLYSLTKGQAAIIAFTRALRHATGNLPTLPGIFPDTMAPVVRNAPIGTTTNRGLDIIMGERTL